MQQNYKEIWDRCLQIIRDNIPRKNYETWFEPIVPLDIDDSLLKIQVPSEFFYEWLESHYLDLISKTLHNVIGKEAKLEYHIVMNKNNNNVEKPYIVKLPGHDQTEFSNRPVQMPLDVNEHSIMVNPFIIPGIQKTKIDPNLNPEYTFASFMEGDCNRLARAAGYAISERPGQTSFNPLFIYGASGLGKTHLAQAIGIQVKTLLPEKIVLYVDANKFLTQYMEATRRNNRNDFIHFYQMIDVLIVDDVQYFSKKEGTQEVFFHIFNHLHQRGKQIVLTSDKPPVELSGMEERLLSRFKWGLSAELTEPDFNTRMAILKQKTYKDGIEIDIEVLEYIASHITSNVRELEGALISLLAQSTLNKKEITLILAKEIIDKLVKSMRQELSLDYIQKIVCTHLNLPVESLRSKTRQREIVQARQIAMYFAKNHTTKSLSHIGNAIGGKDHATVLHAYKTITNLLDVDKNLRKNVDDIEKRLTM